MGYRKRSNISSKRKQLCYEVSIEGEGMIMRTKGLKPALEYREDLVKQEGYMMSQVRVHLWDFSSTKPKLIESIV